MIPAWLQRHLEALGRHNPDGVGRAARPTHCRACGATIVAGLDADMCAIPASVDPAPLDAAGELAALLTGRATYRLTGTPTRMELNMRSQFEIRHSPPGADTVVVAAHECGKPLAEMPRVSPAAIHHDTNEVPF